ncbi:Cytidine deaminase [Strongyloides ratti]|uniref:Cytidine deaminase n=1 Tax=Strongyloides ratti TaxID=34506 RepID=A0A090MMX0_STRRB|nr:Cytidine deaminase [Strongyloides ratti]CEF59381.1 Cytidine deaminase [Strongyloides ratti]
MQNAVVISDSELIEASVKVMKNSYSPYSNFPVGAALLTKCGKIITGANIENASFGGTICAERSAFVSAISSGYKDFVAVAVSTNLAVPGSPCGICRQFMIEFGNIKVILNSTTTNKIEIVELKDLLPKAFTPKSLETFNEENKGKN